MNAGDIAARNDLELGLPADPALALTARMFAGAVARQAGVAEAADDLKLAFSELLAAAVEDGAPEVRFRVAIRPGGRLDVVVAGAQGLDAGAFGEPADDLEAFARSHRRDLLTGVFPGLRVEDELVRFGFDAGG